MLQIPGGAARLEPLSAAHAVDLLDAGGDEAVWRYLPDKRPETLEQMQRYIADALNRSAGGRGAAFAIIADGRAVGSTRYLDFDAANRSVEIGYTWHGRVWQRTSINTECKFLLLQHAFEELGCVRVQFKTDARNLASQEALRRIGARFEGVLRKQRILHDGFQRDSHFFSILDGEWPEVRAGLLQKLGRSPKPAA